MASRPCSQVHRLASLLTDVPAYRPAGFLNVPFFGATRGAGAGRARAGEGEQEGEERGRGGERGSKGLRRREREEEGGLCDMGVTRHVMLRFMYVFEYHLFRWLLFRSILLSSYDSLGPQPCSQGRAGARLELAVGPLAAPPLPTLSISFCFLPGGREPHNPKETLIVRSMSNPRTRNLYVRGFDSKQILIFKGLIFPDRIGFPPNLDSGFLILWILSMWTDLTSPRRKQVSQRSRNPPRSRTFPKQVHASKANSPLQAASRKQAR